MRSIADGAAGKTTAQLRGFAKLGLLQHAVVYVLVMALLAAINLIEGPRHLWFLWPLFGWGLGLLLHTLGVFVFGPGSRLYERLVDQPARHER